MLTRSKALRKVFVLIGCLALMAQTSLYGSENDAAALQESVTISGNVTEASTGEPIPGVSIAVKGGAAGTITDIDGNYSIVVNAGDILQFSFVGYLTEEITVGAETTINVSLVENIIDLEELVVVGYGVQKKKLNTGATLNVKGEDIQERNTTSAMDALQGISPGVSITRNNGLPGSGTKVYVRGIGTTGDSDPLYVVDGVTVGDINYLNPADIESIDVLKDAASAAIYGSRAANGVILVTTKKGREGKIQVTYDGYIGWSNPYKVPELLNAQQYAEIMDSASVNSGFGPHDFADDVPYWDSIVNGQWEGTNWLEEFQNKNALSQSHSFGFTGGNEKSSYSMGVGYLEEEGIYGKGLNSTYKRLNLRLNSEHVLWEANGMKILTVGENLTYTNTKNPTIRTGNIYWNDLHNMLVASPFLPAYADSTGDPAYPYHYAIAWEGGAGNPLASAALNSKHNENNNNTIVGNAYLDLQPIKNLHLRSSFGINNWYGSSRNWSPDYNHSEVSQRTVDEVSQSMYSGYTWTWTNTATYNFDLNNIHNFTVLLGTETIKNDKSLDISGTAQNTIFYNAEYAYLDNVPELDENTRLSGRDDFGWGLLSYFGRLSYDYKEKYLLTAVVRRDASSNFKKGNRWGTFPSLAVGWVISSEPFMEGVTGFMNYAKIRASWGQNGNENIAAFQYLASISFDNEEYFFGVDKTSRYPGAYPPILPNPDVTWETSEQLNLGFDLNFINNQLQFTFDLYKKDTKDWLVVAPALATNGTGAPFINGGDVTNRGIELMLSWNDRMGDFRYSITGNFAYNQNEVVDIANDEKIIHGADNVLSQGTSELFRAEVGYPIGYFWGYETDGIIQTQAEADAWINADGEPYFNDTQPGDVRFVDTNGDGEINDDDKVMIGDPNPDFIYGIQLNLDYKGIYLQLIGTGQGGHQVAKSYRSFADSPRQNYTTDIYDRWTGPGTSNEYPQLRWRPHRNTSYVSDLYIEDADFFRISNLTVGYDLSQSLKVIPFEQTKIYVGVRNLLTITKYSGMDPEVGYGPTDDSNPDNDFPWAKGIDLGLYPVARTFLVGLSLKF